MILSEEVLLTVRLSSALPLLVITLRSIASHRAIQDKIGKAKLPLPTLLATRGLAMQIGFGALKKSGFYTVIATLGLISWAVNATLIAHRFWTMFGR